MGMTQKIDVVLDKSIEEVEKQLNTNFDKHGWEIIHKDVLRTVEDNMVKTFVGVTSAYGGVTINSYLADGGGYTPYYLKLTENTGFKTRIEIVVTGSERTTGDSAGRNQGVSQVLIKMCEGDYERKTPSQLAKNLLGKVLKKRN